MSRVLVLLLALVAACSTTPTTTTQSPPTTTPPPPISTTAGAAATAAPPTTTMPPAFTMDDHVEWLLGLLNGEPPAEEDYEARFDEGFRAVVPFEALAAPLAQLAGDWTVVDDRRSGSEATVILAAQEGARLVATFVQEDGRAGRLGGLLLQPDSLDDPPESLDGLVDRWSQLAPRSAFVVADPSCAPVTGAAGAGQLAIGSVFKLWVLHALSAAVAEGGASWDEVLLVRDELKSLPSGTMQDEPAGAELTLEQAAELMISISDNTATDHLIDRLGREAVEAAVAASGHVEPGRNRPFLTTRELFWLKLAAPREVVVAYLEGDEATRRDILDAAAIDLAGIEPTAFTEPIEIETLEWFASAGDVCRVLTSLVEGFADTPVPDILSANPGVVVDEAAWPRLAFKGGSEPGVLALAWHATRADGEEFVIVGILNDPDAPLDEVTAVLLAQRAFELLASS